MIRRLLCWFGWHNKLVYLETRKSTYDTPYTFWACEQCGRKIVVQEQAHFRSRVNPLWAHNALDKDYEEEQSK